MKQVHTATWQQFKQECEPIHWNNPMAVSGLHDVWRMGAPTPDSYIDPTISSYDERVTTKGVIIKRIILYPYWSLWAQDVLKARGVVHTVDELHQYYLDMANGNIDTIRAIYGFDAR